MIISQKNIILFIFIIGVSFANAVVESSISQDETTQSDSGSFSNVIGSETSQDDTQEPKRLKTIPDYDDILIENLEEPQGENPYLKIYPNPNYKPTPKITQIPEKILEFFNNAEFPDTDRLDNPASYHSNEDTFKKSFENTDQLDNPASYDSNEDTFKKSFEDYQKYIPFMIQREKYKKIPTTYFQAGNLILKLLSMYDLKDTSNKNKLIEYIRELEPSKREFNRHHYYDWWFSSRGKGKRLIPACPKEEIETKEFPTGSILKPMTEELEMSLEDDGVFSSDEDNKPTSPSHPSTPTRSNSNESISNIEETQIELPPLSPTVADKSAPTKQPPTRSKSSLGQKIKKKTSKIFKSVPIQAFADITSIFSKWQSSEPKPKINKPGFTQQIITNTFKGRILNAQTVIENEDYIASNFPCKEELKPSFVKEEIFKKFDGYYIGYLADFGKKVAPLVGNLVSVSDTMMWFHIGHLMMDNETKDTYSVFNYTTFYTAVRDMKNIPIYTDYTVNENSHANVEYYRRMYSIDNQKKVFESFENHQKYFDPDRSLVLVEQELMDQKSIPIMAQKRAALDYMNIAPMYKIIKDKTWSKVENVVLKLPVITNDYASTVIFVTGTYGALQLNDSPVGLYLDSDGEIDGIKRLKVPYAFYKIVHIEYHSPKLDKIIQDHMKFFFSIVIVTHNDPFETNPEKICEKPVVCSSIGWKKVEQRDPAFGYTYCCAFTAEFAKFLGINPMYESITTDELLDLRLLWYVGRNESIHPLERDEFKLINVKKPIYETADGS